MRKMMLVFLMGLLLTGCTMFQSVSHSLLRERRIGNPSGDYQVLIDPRDTRQVRVHF